MPWLCVLSTGVPDAVAESSLEEGLVLLQSRAQKVKTDAASHGRKQESLMNARSRNVQGHSMIDFSHASILNNNLGGQGPDLAGPANIHYGPVGTVCGRPYDLIVTNSTPYTPDNAGRNVLRNGLLAQINVAFDLPSGGAENYTVTDGRLNFAFVDSELGTPVVLPRFFFTIVDIEQGSDYAPESVHLSGFDNYYLDPGSHVAVQEEGGVTEFRSTSWGARCDNPNDPMNLVVTTCRGDTVNQRWRTVLFEFSNKASFDVRFQASCFRARACRGGRNFLFAGRSSLLDLVPHMPTIEVDDSELFNLPVDLMPRLDPGTVFGGAEGFSVIFSATWTDLGYWSHVIDFGNEDWHNNIVVGNSKNTTAFGFHVYDEAVKNYYLNIPNVIEVGRMDRFLCTVSPDGHMKVYRAGQLIGEKPDGLTPNNNIRNHLWVGKSFWDTDSTFDGVIEDMCFWNKEVSWDSAALGCPENLC